MLYQEQFADTRALMGEIDSFLTHVEPLNIKLSGDVLVIGPAPDLIDLVVVEPQLNRVKSITIVDQDFRAERAGFLSIFQQCHPDVAVTLIQPKRFQDLTQTFDAIIFIGASAYFHICNSYLSIPNRLKPGGKFFGTCNFPLEAATVSLTQDSTMEVIVSVPGHPRWEPDWTGIIIEKAQH